MDIVTEARQCGKHQAAIARLPDEPEKKIVWIVYNDDLVQYTRDMIVLIKGEDYLDNHVIVTTRAKSSRCVGSVVFDPFFFDHLGNGNI